MGEFNFIEEANQTLSKFWFGHLVSAQAFRETLNKAIEALEDLDHIKKALFYGRENPAFGGVRTIQALAHNIAQGVDHAPVSEDDLTKTEILIHSILGIATEGGELLEAELRRVVAEAEEI